MASKSNKYFSRPIIGLIEHKVELERLYPESHSYIKNGVLFWSAEVKPDKFSRMYTLKIEYRIGKNPCIWLMNADINSERENIPHNYEVDKEKQRVRLCLFKPGREEWTKYDSIAKTIVPWAIEWLFYYEIWLITGEWKGGGEHPSNTKDSNVVR